MPADQLQQPQTKSKVEQLSFDDQPDNTTKGITEEFATLMKQKAKTSSGAENIANKLGSSDSVAIASPTQNVTLTPEQRSRIFRNRPQIFRTRTPDSKTQPNTADVTTTQPEGKTVTPDVKLKNTAVDQIDFASKYAGEIKRIGDNISNGATRIIDKEPVVSAQKKEAGAIQNETPTESQDSPVTPDTKQIQALMDLSKDASLDDPKFMSKMQALVSEAQSQLIPKPDGGVKGEVLPDTTVAQNKNEARGLFGKLKDKARAKWNTMDFKQKSALILGIAALAAAATIVAPFAFAAATGTAGPFQFGLASNLLLTNLNAVGVTKGGMVAAATMAGQATAVKGVLAYGVAGLGLGYLGLRSKKTESTAEAPTEEPQDVETMGVSPETQVILDKINEDGFYRLDVPHERGGGIGADSFEMRVDGDMVYLTGAGGEKTEMTKTDFANRQDVQKGHIDKLKPSELKSDRSSYEAFPRDVVEKMLNSLKSGENIQLNKQYTDQGGVSQIATFTYILDVQPNGDRNFILQNKDGLKKNGQIPEGYSGDMDSDGLIKLIVSGDFTPSTDMTLPVQRSIFDADIQPEPPTEPLAITKFEKPTTEIQPTDTENGKLANLGSAIEQQQSDPRFEQFNKLLKKTPVGFATELRDKQGNKIQMIKSGENTFNLVSQNGQGGEFPTDTVAKMLATGFLTGLGELDTPTTIQQAESTDSPKNMAESKTTDKLRPATKESAFAMPSSEMRLNDKMDKIFKAGELMKSVNITIGGVSRSFDFRQNGNVLGMVLAEKKGINSFTAEQLTAKINSGEITAVDAV